MLKTLSTAVAATMLFAAPGAATTLSLEYLRSFDVDVSAEGIAFDAANNQVIVVNDTSTAYRFAPDGAGGLLSSFTIARSKGDMRGISAFGANFLGAEDDSSDRAIVEFDGTGTSATDALFVDLESDGAVDVNDSNGVVHDPDTGEIFHADEDDDVVRRFSASGDFLEEIDIDPDTSDVEGIEINPFNGNLLIADDLVNGGSILEFTRSGSLVMTIAYGTLLPDTLDSHDPMGLAVDRTLNELYVANDSSTRVDVFAMTEGSAALTPVPVPAALPMFVAGIAALRLAARRRKQA